MHIKNKFLLLVFLSPLFFSCSHHQPYHFGDNLKCLQCQAGPVVPEGQLLFCILGYEGRTSGVMPAVFLEREDGQREEIWRDRDRSYHPWRIEVVKLDDDPEPQIAIGVYKKTRRDPHLARRLFIYDWTGYCLSPKWLGSRLALPMEDFKFIRPAGSRYDQLVALEQTPDSKLIRKYRWNGFGFIAMETVSYGTRTEGQDRLSELFKNL
jgi:hypothetical protein